MITELQSRSKSEVLESQDQPERSSLGGISELLIYPSIEKSFYGEFVGVKVPCLLLYIVRRLGIRNWVLQCKTVLSHM